jgi:hypothetical protein
VAVTVALQGCKQPVKLVLGERLALAAVGFGPFDFPLYVILTDLSCLAIIDTFPPANVTLST